MLYSHVSPRPPLWMQGPCWNQRPWVRILLRAALRRAEGEWNAHTHTHTHTHAHVQFQSADCPCPSEMTCLSFSVSVLNCESPQPFRFHSHFRTACATRTQTLHVIETVTSPEHSVLLEPRLWICSCDVGVTVADFGGVKPISGAGAKVSV